MENIEDKLRDFRVKKRRRQQLQHVKDWIQDFFTLRVMGEKPETQPITLHVVPESDDDPQSVLHCTDVEDESDIEDAIDNTYNRSNEISAKHMTLKYTLWVVYIVFWITLYVICIELQFGIVFLMLSALVCIYLNTRTGPKKHNEVSAYSVFNKNCTSIDGTLKAEQFEREMGIR